MGAGPRVAVQTIRSRDHLRSHSWLRSAAYRGICLDPTSLGDIRTADRLRTMPTRAMPVRAAQWPSSDRRQMSGGFRRPSPLNPRPNRLQPVTGVDLGGWHYILPGRLDGPTGHLTGLPRFAKSSSARDPSVPCRTVQRDQFGGRELDSLRLEARVGAP